MDSLIKTTSKNAAQEEQQQHVKSTVEDEVFGQGEMVDIVSDPLTTKLESREPLTDPLQSKGPSIWADSQSPTSEKDHLDPDRKPVEKAVAIGERLKLRHIRDGLMDDDPHALEKTNDDIVALAEGGLENDQPNLLSKLSASLQKTRKRAKKGKSKTEASPVELHELRDTALATLGLHNAMEEANLEVSGQLEFQKLSAEEQDETADDLRDVDTLDVPGGDVQELMDEENLIIIPVVTEVDFVEADKEPEYEIVNIREIDDLSLD